MQTWLIFFTSVISLGIFSQWFAWKIKVPSILPLLVFGFAAGQFVNGAIILEEDVLFAVVSLSVAVIMLEGGLSLRFEELRECGTPLIRLITLGALITWLLSTLSLHWIANFSWQVSLLVGAILVVTGPTVIGPLLRNIKPRRQLNSLLKWEGIVIDPIGAILAVLVFGALFGHGHDTGESNSILGVIKQLGLTILVGLGLSYATGKLVLSVLRRHWIPDYLQSVVILAVALGLFTISNVIQHESGLLTVTIFGVILVNQEKASVRHIVEFKENLRVLLISCLFIVLGGRIGWEEVVAVWKESLGLIFVLILIIRPVSVYLSCLGTGLSFREKTFLALLAPRGIVAAAVSAIFALELSHQGGVFAEESARIVPVIFSVIFGTVSFYGLASPLIARKLGLATPNPQGLLIAGANPWSIALGVTLQEADYRVLMIDSSHSSTSEARMQGLKAITANAMSDYAAESIDLSGIGRFLAVTPNDQVNSLACMSFGHALGRSNVFQLLPRDAGEGHRNASSYELSGRALFKDELTYDNLNTRFRENPKVRSTLITDEFTYEDYIEKNNHLLVPVFIMRANGDLSIVHETISDPVTGDTVIALDSEDQMD